MGRRTLENRHLRNLQKTAGGSSYMITLPIDLVRELGWKSRQKLVVKKYGEGLLIKDWQEGS